MKKIFTLIIILLSSFLSFCQTTFQPGYFISNNGDKSECLIKNLAWKNNPITFAYKSSLNEDVKTESIDNISYFSVSDYQFERFNVELDVSTNDMSRMSVTADPEWEKGLFCQKSR